MVTLKEIAREDLKTFNRWRHDLEIMNYLAAPFRYISLEVEDEWFDSYQKNRSTQMRCSIFVEGTTEPIGIVSLMHIDPINRNAEFHITIGETKFHDVGVGAEVTQKIVDHAFQNLNLKRVYLVVMEDNIRAVRMYEKIGFVREGILRSAVFKQGQYKDLVLMSILNVE